MQSADIEDWKDFLKEMGCENIRDDGDWIMCNCIFHEQSDRTRPSLGIYKNSGAGKCFGCGTHSWKDFCNVWGISSVDFLDTVRESSWNLFKRRLLDDKGKQKFLRFKLPNNLVDFETDKRSVKYFKDRFMDVDLVKSFGVKLCKDEASKYFDYLIFPIMDEKGVLFFDARYVGTGGESRWLRPKNCAFWKTYFNWVNIKNFKRLIFVEGVPDAIKMVQFGFKETIPAKDFSSNQFRMILNSGVEIIVLLYDNDAAGRWAKSKSGKEISFTARALQQFSDTGIKMIVGKIPDKYKDAGDIKSYGEFSSINDWINF
jgi:DNA primase